ncbi:SPFH/Band 7/PHB domain protein [Alicyclobacillus cycloheptanicus]|uniref:Regulator of protease activity HflC (Stomatin/prohibitin superfamily) n=1 Tax=Alicyclobacillus cycloheptanicus TaxID=1457 RepID=A0ABT9XM05_9BACL|nr:SPFH domain-containing protein [Alicyclobacillus cycloheptanicus]MDQ0191349.1 regulator of protease activity HflC (stomatin/prohibitin superfamily) [Alicyclobacillus cycloheptanicus]WDL99832.1 SPFH/Band 7/PHB domain protein [Alicyclobacillus cycloheptanicus]
MITTIVVVVIILLVVVILLRGIRIIPQQRVAIVERLGRYHAALSAGVNIIVPFVDRVVRTLDLRTQQVVVPPQVVITKDNVQIQIDTVFFYTIVEPKMATYNIADVVQGIQNITAANIRQVAGHMELDETLAGRDRISISLRTALDEVTESWGVRIDRVEIVDIKPPREIQDAMEKQMKAEREKRANILQAEGERQSKILQAEGEKQSAILRAEGEREARIRQAEGLRQSQQLEADGRAQAIRLVAEAEKTRIEMLRAAGLDANVLTYQSFDALKGIAEGPATTLFVPSEAVGVLSALGTLKKAWQGTSDEDGADQHGTKQ